MSTHDNIEREKDIDQANQNEEYEPSEVREALETQLRITAAQLAVQIPWNPTEPITTDGLKDRLQLMYDWLKEATNKDLDPNS